MEQNVYFLTFGASNSDYTQAAERIKQQAAEFNIFTDIISYTDIELKNDEEFWSKNGEFIENNKRGYGYWLWKPYIIMKTLERLSENDILFYCDSGCELNVEGKTRFLSFLEEVNEKLIMGTGTCSSDYTYTKKDLIEYIGITDVNVLKIRHMQAGCLLMKKTDIIINLISEWYSIGSNNYHFIDDSPSISENFPGFREHRHDQSIYNLLVKKYDLLNYSLDPTNWGNTLTSKDNYLNNAMSFPIWYCRNRTGKSLKDP